MRALVPTTIAGSLPKPEWLAPAKQLWAPWLLEGERLVEGKRDAVKLALFDQEHAGIDIVTDGEQTRRHFVNGYMERLEGIDFKNLKTVRIRNRYDANVPRVVGPVTRQTVGLQPPGAAARRLRGRAAMPSASPCCRARLSRPHPVRTCRLWPGSAC